MQGKFQRQSSGQVYWILFFGMYLQKSWKCGKEVEDTVPLEDLLKYMGFRTTGN